MPPTFLRTRPARAAVALGLLAAAWPAPAAIRDPSGSSVSSPPAQYRGPVGEIRGRGASPFEAGPVAGGSPGSPEGRDRWEFWFEYGKDELIRTALRRSRHGKVEDPDPPGGLRHRPDAVGRADIEDRLRPALRAALLDPAAPVRAAAAEALGNSGDGRSLPALLATLRSGGSAERRAAATALGILGDSSATTALGSAMNRDPDAETRSRAAYSLGVSGDPDGVALIREALVRGFRGGGGRHGFAADAVSALGLSGDRAQVPFLLGVLISGDSRDPRIHAAAAGALALLKDPAALPTLRAVARRAGDARLRRAATQALGSFDDPALGAVLRGIAGTDSDGVVRGLAAVSLARVERAGAVPFLAELVRPDRPRTVRGFATVALGIAGDEAAAAPILREILAGRSEDSHRGAAAVALGLLRSGAAARDLAGVAQDPASPPSLRGYALLGLALTGHSSGPLLLREALVGDSRPGLLRGAVLGAGAHPFPGSDALLFSVLDGAADPMVRGAALLGLGLAADRGGLDRLVARATDREGTAEMDRLQAVLALGQIALESRLPPVARIASGSSWHGLTPAADAVTRGF